MAKILIVEDNALNIKLFCDLLAAHGHEPEAVTDSRNALDAARAFWPDLVITDIQMEEMSGLELLQRVAASKMDTDVIVITAYEDMRSAIGAIRDGAYDYMVKPVDLDQLDMVLRRCLRDRAARKRQADEPSTGRVVDGS